MNRDVAIKTLPAAFADDAERMARFQREAQVLAALNHPHIAAIYGIEEPAIVIFDERFPQLSPDGKWVAYESDESGKDEVYVEPFPGPGGKSQISTEGGIRPVWARNGRELFYREPSTNMEMSVEIPAGPVFRAGHPEALFKMYGPSPTAVEFTVTPDPKFLIERMAEGQAVTTLVTITDWFDDLRRRAPLKK